jgi:hypothetical protein
MRGSIESIHVFNVPGRTKCQETAIAPYIENPVGGLENRGQIVLTETQRGRTLARQEQFFACLVEVASPVHRLPFRQEPSQFLTQVREGLPRERQDSQLLEHLFLCCFYARNLV